MFVFACLHRMCVCVCVYTKMEETIDWRGPLTRCYYSEHTIGGNEGAGRSSKRGGLGFRHQTLPPGDSWPFALSLYLSISDKSEPKSFLMPLALRWQGWKQWGKDWEEVQVEKGKSVLHSTSFLILSMQWVQLFSLQSYVKVHPAS